MGCGPYSGVGLEVLGLAPQGFQSFLCHQVPSKMEIPLCNACCESLRMDVRINI